MLQFIFSAAALVLAFLFVFVFPEFGQWDNLLGVTSAIAGVYGITDWRNKVSKWKNFFDSDTKLGAILIGLAVLINAAINQFGVDVPGVVQDVLLWIVAGAGAGELFGGSRDALIEGRK